MYPNNSAPSRVVYRRTVINQMHLLSSRLDIVVHIHHHQFSCFLITDQIPKTKSLGFVGFGECLESRNVSRVQFFRLVFPHWRSSGDGARSMAARFVTNGIDPSCSFKNWAVLVYHTVVVNVGGMHFEPYISRTVLSEHARSKHEQRWKSRALRRYIQYEIDHTYTTYSPYSSRLESEYKRIEI